MGRGNEGDAGEWGVKEKEGGWGVYGEEGEVKELMEEGKVWEGGVGGGEGRGW